MKTKIKYKHVFRIAIFSMLLISTASCSLMTIMYIHGASAIYDGNKDVSSDSRFAHMINKSFRLKMDMFYFKYSDEETRYLKSGAHSALPSSIKAYERDPYNWMSTDDNANMGRGKADGYDKAIVFGVVKAGTKITIKKIFLHKSHSSLFGNSYHFVAQIGSGKFIGNEVDISDLLKNTRESEINKLITDEKFLEEISYNVGF